MARRGLQTSETVLIRGVCIVLLGAAAGRALSIASAGRPHDLYVVLLAVEVLIVAVVWPWQAAVARRMDPSEPKESKK